ncbi:SusC/RagA family TonB-linked outer membrane protein [Arcticibacter eurypsychrophilus]|uniref:SusC/RagA family TonB-linked outer membrane protein n=1 Tax=Arcticibacter eurypsychrophilus TaxID=1434752 RepID=UPI00084D0B03|nr:SusC/RagA family TonB-linked outer membrane protein [Arcticibacter eurypsychrophilus]
MKKKYFYRFDLIVICLLFIMPCVQAQTPATTVRGKVIDKGDRLPIAGATVIIVDQERRTVNGTSTDIEGNYVLKVAKPEYRIMVSFISYKSTQPLAIAGKAIINFQLEGMSNELTTVVIKGVAKAKGNDLHLDKKNLTTAVATIEAKDLEEMQAASIDQALQGRLPGVDITAGSGDPGAGMQIRIRGVSSINGVSDPLIVVDGMIYEITIPSDFNFATSDENGYGQLLNIAPSDIQDISVLKDAAATAVWGSRAANGVLVINTKRGAIGTPKVTYTFKGSLSKQPDAIPMLNGDQYSTLISEEFYNSGVQFSTNESAKQFQYDPNDPYNYYNFSNNTDWVKAITQTGYMQDHNISINGGGEKATYFASVGYFNQAGTTKGTDLSRITARINLDYNVSSRIHFRSDISYTHLDNSALYDKYNRDIAYSKMPNQSIYEYDEFGNLTSNYFSPATTAQGTIGYNSKDEIIGTYNALAMAMASTNRQIGERIMPKFNLRYEIIPSILTASSDLLININNNKYKTFLPQIATGRPFIENSVNRATDNDADDFGISTKTNFIYTPKISENHSFTGLLSFQSNDVTTTSQSLKSSNTASSFLDDPSIDSRTNLVNSAKSSVIESRSVGVLLNGQYGYLNRYLLNVSLRGDGNSKFGPANRYGFFPSISGRWRISDEPIMRDLKFLNEFSLRASYGKLGNAPKYDYRYFNIYQSSSISYLGETGVYPSNIELSDLRWETVTGKNVGLNLALFNNRISLDAELYRNRTSDLFYENLQVASYNGFSGLDMNVGIMDNQGWEISLNTNVINKKNLRFDFNFNVAHNENMIREISPLYPRENAGKITTNGTWKTYVQENTPFGSFYGFKFQGVYKDKEATIATDKAGNPIIGPNGDKVYMRFAYPSIDYVFQPGDAKYEDINHDGSIDYKDIVYLGNGNPKLTGGFGPSFTFKGNLKLSAFFTYRQGFDLINGTKITTTSMYGFGNQSTAVLKRWKTEGDVTDMPRAMYRKGYNYLGSSRYVEDGSFVKLRSVTVRYDFVKSVLQRLNLSGLSTYLTAENLFTFTKYTGQDPEVSTKINGPFSTIIDNSMTPAAKTVTFGLSVRF